jgi:hypothetical protein
MNVNDYKNIVVLLDVDMGSNHLANLIATSDQLQDRVVKLDTDYKSILVDFYKKGHKNAHVMDWGTGFNSFGNLIFPEFLNVVQSYQRPGVLNGHLGALYGESGDLLRTLGRNLLLLGSAESLNEYIQSRVSGEIIERFLANYKKAKVSNFSSIHSALAQDIIEFDPNLLFSPDITPLLMDLDQQLNLELDVGFCQQLHELWFKNIFFKGNQMKKSFDLSKE